MGLGVEVGVLSDMLVHDPEGASWFNDELTGMNEVLKDKGLPVHREPRRLPDFTLRGVMGFPYNFVHHLRRAYVFAKRGEPAPDGDLAPAHVDAVAEEENLDASHLLCHSDSEGYYVPIEFAPIIDDRVPGEVLCSTQGLLAELLVTAPALGIALEDGAPTAAAVDALMDLQESQPHYREKLVWFAFYEACRVSIEHKALIVFS